MNALNFSPGERARFPAAELYIPEEDCGILPL